MKLIHFVFLVTLWVPTQSVEDCPEQCQCDKEKKKWTCGGQNITNGILLEISQNGDPSTARELLLKKNLITDFPTYAFENFTALEILDLGENFITKVPQDLKKYIPSLTELKLNQNNLVSLEKDDFVSYGNIESLDLFKNNIQQIEPGVFEFLPNLIKLFAEGNMISILPEGSLDSLKDLLWVSFQGNQVTEISKGFLGDNRKLQRIWLGHNRLTSLPVDLFKNASGLYILNLDNNQIEDSGLPDKIFDLKLEELNLRNNSLTTLKKEWFGVIDYDLYLEDIPINCDCSLQDTYRYLAKKSSNFAVVGKCASPSSMNGKPLSDVLSQNQLKCDSCSLSQCQHNSTCTVIDEDTYKCTCSDLYYGEYCENENLCINGPCLNNGTCTNSNPSSFQCDCPQGFLGATCNLEQPCFFNNPCLNNGTCISINKNTTYICQCIEEFEGMNCEQLKEEEQKLNVGILVIIILIILALITTLAVCIYVRRKKDEKSMQSEKVALNSNNPISA